MPIHRVGVLSAGGDCPGINAVIHAVVKKAILDYQMEVYGIFDGFAGLVEGRWRTLQYNDVSGIMPLGGTILGTSNKANPFKYPCTEYGKLCFKDLSQEVIDNYHSMGLQALIAIGGDGTFHISNGFIKKGLSIVGVPKTIDNDLSETDFTFGFDSAVWVATDAIDRLHTTAQAHHRVMVIEVMGRYAGWIALHSGIAGGGDVILIPEIHYNIDNVCTFIRKRIAAGKKFSIVVVAEGSKPQGGDYTILRKIEESHDQIRLGGVGHLIGEQIEEKTGIETRVVILGHLLRGGSPTPYDRVLASRFGAAAVDLVAQEQFGLFPALRGNEMMPTPIKKAIEKLKIIPLNHSLLQVARSTGTCLGE